MERRRGCCRCDEPTAGSQSPFGSGGPGLAGGTSGSSAVTVSCGITGAGGARGSPLGTCPPRRLAPRARGSPAAAAAATAAQRASKSRRSSPTLRRGARSSPGLQGPAPPGRAMPVGPPGRVISRHKAAVEPTSPRRGGDWRRSAPGAGDCPEAEPAPPPAGAPPRPRPPPTPFTFRESAGLQGPLLCGQGSLLLSSQWRGSPDVVDLKPGPGPHGLPVPALEETGGAAPPPGPTAFPGFGAGEDFSCGLQGP